MTRKQRGLKQVLLATVCILMVSGCDRTQRTLPCEEGPLPAAFKAVSEDLLPSMRVCSRAARERVVHIDFDGVKTPHDAWMASVDHFEGRGWKRVDQQASGRNLRVMFRRGNTYLTVKGISEMDENEPFRDLFLSPKVRGSLEIYVKDRS